jgi:cytoplasmic iron level regulating protein YaaA (DUF328/UPF0246 family)
MLFLLSPAKSLDYETPTGNTPHTQPLFIEQSTTLISALKKISGRQISKLMGLSDELSRLNVERYQAWTPEFTDANSRQAVLAFNGDVYGGLQAKTMKPADLQWVQQHVCILSGLYGVLRPLDRMQPYRLEMGTALKTRSAANLYRFWGSKISEYLNERLQVDKSPVVVNLASQEYFKAVDRKALQARVIDCVFEEWHGGKFKIISFNAKRARGLMTRYAVDKRVTLPHQLEDFSSEGYAYDASVSQADRLVFRRKAS